MTQRTKRAETQPSKQAETPLHGPKAAEGLVTLPMTRPLDPESCPCGGLSQVDGFCEQHTGAVAFRVPLTSNGEVLPAVDWQWSHDDPCPHGDSWRIQSPPADGSRALRSWACPHRSH